LRPIFGPRGAPHPNNLIHRLYELLEDTACADAATRALHTMRRIVVEELEDGVSMR
jgi:hypothetical protein